MMACQMMIEKMAVFVVILLLASSVSAGLVDDLRDYQSLDDIITGISQLFGGVRTLGRGLILAGNAIVSLLVGEYEPYTQLISGLGELFLTLLAIKMAWRITKTATKYVVLFILLTIMFSIILGGTHFIPSLTL